MIVFALQEIVPGEEITVDYLNSFAEDQSVCHCRTPSCRQRTDQRQPRRPGRTIGSQITV
jgi:SET domain-containing protein